MYRQMACTTSTLETSRKIEVSKVSFRSKKVFNTMVQNWLARLHNNPFPLSGAFH